MTSTIKTERSVSLTQENVGVNLKDAADVSAAVSNVLKFRRMTIGGNLAPSITNQETPTESPGARRKSSIFFKGLSQSFTSMIKFRKMSVLQAAAPEKPKIKCENTYKLGPDADNTFKTTAVEKKTYEVLENELKTTRYDANTAGRIACRLSNIVKNEIKSLNMPRHRLICQVVITEVRGQDMEAASRCLWDDKSDNYACVSYKNDTLLAIAMVYGVYMD